MKRFSIEEARAAIPQLERIFASARDIRSQAEAKARAIRGLQAKTEPDTARLAMEAAQLEFMVNSLEKALEGIARLGAVFKGLDPGLVDFPCRLGEAEVYLCWRCGEKEITHYHGLEEGFADRKPLSKRTLPH